MPKVTRIKASDTSPRDEADEDAAIVRKKVVAKDKKTEKDKRKERKEAEKKVSGEEVKAIADVKDGGAKAGAEKTNVTRKEKKPFILIRPIVYFFRYLRDSWKELRQVRWPNRKSTWGMVFAVLVYTLIFLALISLLDLLFKWLFGLVLGS